MNKAGLLNTSSALALAVFLGPASPATAQETKLIFEGQVGWSSGSEQPWSVLSPPFPFQTLTIAPDTNYQATVGIVTPSSGAFPVLGDGLDIAVFASFGRSNSEKAGGVAYYYYNALGGNYSTFYSQGSVEHTETHAFVDFEARQDVGLGSDSSGTLTTFVGASFGYLGADTETEFVYLPSPALYTLNEKRKSEFIGVGPRIGFERVIPLAENLSFDISGSASALFGRRNTSTVTSGSLFFVSNQLHESTFEIVGRLAARFGITYYSPTMPYTLGIGVEGRAWLNAFDQQTNVGLAPRLGDGSADRYSINPYVRLTMAIGGDKRQLSPKTDDSVPLESRFGDRVPTTEVQLRGGLMDRDGNAINQTLPVTEDDGFGLFGAGLLYANPVADNWLFQVEGDWETRLSGDGVSDNFESGYSVASHLALTNGQFLLGGFAGFGRSNIQSGGTVDQDADLWFFGAQGRVLNEKGALFVQGGVLDSSSDNPETISDAIFGRFGTQFFSSDGRTALTADVTYIEGEQDTDSFLGPDPVELVSWGVLLEHQLPTQFNDADVTAFASYRNIRIDEQNTALTTDSINDDLFEVGIKISLGGSTIAQRQHDTAPGVPKFHRYLGAVAAVD